MADPVSSTPATGAQSSIGGWFGSLVNNILPAARDVLVAKYESDNGYQDRGVVGPGAGAGKGAGKGAGTGQTGDWRDTVATPEPITQKPWFIPAIIGGVIVLLVAGMALFRGRSKD